jgi:hypothetical protein
LAQAERKHQKRPASGPRRALGGRPRQTAHRDKAHRGSEPTEPIPD